MSGAMGRFPGGGAKINGIVKQYIAAEGENISAGDFVKFVNQAYANPTDEELSTAEYMGTSIVVLLLSDYKILIVHRGGSSSTTLYATIVTIRNRSIIAGEATSLLTGLYAGERFDTNAVILSSNKVFIAYRYGSSGSSSLYGLVITISDMTITVGANTAIVTGTDTAHSVETVALSSSAVFIAYASGASPYAYGIVVTISGTTISKGTSTQLVSNTFSGYNVKALRLSNTSVFLAHRTASTASLSGMIVTISGTTITKGASTEISSNSHSRMVYDVLPLSGNKVYVAHDHGDSSGRSYLYGTVVTIEGTTITPGANTQLLSNNATYGLAAVLLSDDRLLIIYKYANNDLSGMVIKLNGTAITPGTHTCLLTGTGAAVNARAILLIDGRVYVAYGYDAKRYLHGMLIETVDVTIPLYSYVQLEVQKAVPSDALLNGVAKSRNIDNLVDVYVPSWV